jgi:serine/threonine-protein kinase
MSKATSSGSPTLSSLKFLVSSVLGSGPKGTVMLITDKDAGGGRYALRTINREEPADDVLIERARAECEASQKLNHASVLKVYDFRLRRKWFQVSRAELLMEYVDGKTLDAIEGLPIEAALLIYAKVASALAHMHRREVLHGDLTPSNVVLSRTGQVKVRRYGLSLVPAKFREQIKPNVNFSAPEYIKEKVITAQTELYSLAATMYVALTGRPVGNAALGRTEGKKISTPAALNPQVPSALNELVVTCLQSNANRRPPDMYEVVKRLETMVTEMGIEDSVLRGIAAEKE